MVQPPSNGAVYVIRPQLLLDAGAGIAPGCPRRRVGRLLRLIALGGALDARDIDRDRRPRLRPDALVDTVCVRKLNKVAHAQGSLIPTQAHDLCGIKEEVFWAWFILRLEIC